MERIITQGRIWLQSAYFKIKEVSGSDWTSEATGTTQPEADHFYFYGKAKSNVATPYWMDENGVEHEFADAATVPPINADYLVKTSNATLTAERVVTDTTSITVDWSTAGQAKFQREALTGDVTASQNSNATTIANDAVTTAKIINDAVTNAKLANMAAWTYKIRNTSSSGDPSDGALADFTTGTPATGDYVIGFLSTGEIRKFDAGNLGSSSSGGGHLHGMQRLVMDGVLTTVNLLDIAEYLEHALLNGTGIDPLNITLSSDRSQVTLASAGSAGDVLELEYVIAGV